MSGPVILTPRLRLSPLVLDDARAMLEYRADPDVCRYQSFTPGTLSDVEDFIRGVLGHAFDTPGTWFQFAVRRRDTGELIGDLGVRFPADDPHQAEIGFTVAPAHQRRGFAGEAVAGILDHLFHTCGKRRVFASVDPRNTASMALLRRLGWRQEAHHRQSLWFKDEWVDDVVFAMLVDEWKARQTGGETAPPHGGDLHLYPIGVIRTPYTATEGMPIQPPGAAGVAGTVEVRPDLAAGLRDLDGFSHVVLLYAFHRSAGFDLEVVPFLDAKPHGVFATRAPRRPNPLGLSVVRLERIDGHVLHVTDVDVLDGTPLLDIKPHVPAFDAPDDCRTGWLAGLGRRVRDKRSDGRFG